MLCIFCCKNVFKVLKISDIMKKLILVNPAFRGHILGLIGKTLKFANPPIFSVLEAMSPKWDVKVYNQPFKVKYEKGLVGITSFTSNIYRAYKHADKFRKVGAKVIMGGPHVTFRIKEALKHCDSVVVGEVEGVWKQILKDYQNDNLKSVYYGEPKENFWEYYQNGFLKLKDTQKINAIQATRGCKFACKFCTIHKLYKGGLRKVPIEKIVQQIDSVKPFWRTSIFFTDNNLFTDPVYCKKLFEALIPLKITWSGLASIDIAKDDKLLKLAKKSGCNRLGIGFETVNENVIKSNPGKLNLYQDYLKLIKRIKKHKIKITGTFIVGFEEDTFKSLWKLFVFTLKANLHLSFFSILTPFPGTELFDNVVKERKIKVFNWTKYDGLSLVTEHPSFNRFTIQPIFYFFRLSFLVNTTWGRILFALIILSASAYFW